MEQGSALWYYLFPTVLSVIVLLKYKQKATGLFILIILLFFSMFRGDHVGNDTMSYMDPERIQYLGTALDINASREYISDNFGSKTEFITVLLNIVVYNFNLHPRVIIYFYSIITFVFLYLALARFKVNQSIGLLVYVLTGLYYFSLSATRQMAAVSIVLWGMYYLLSPVNDVGLNLSLRYDTKNSALKYIATVIVAGMIHASAIFFITLIFVRYLKVNRKILGVVMIVVAVVCVLLSFNFMDIVYKLINMEYVARYMGLYEEGGRSLMGRLFDILRYSFFIYLFIYCPHQKRANGYDMLYAMAIILLALFVQTNELLARITYYVTVFMCVYIPYALLNRTKTLSGNRLYLFMMYIVISIYGIGKYGYSSLTSGYYLMF